ncbi:sugar phosphate nucleotidyltransferase [Haloarculaceae archaeon H-GB2-1]|nr:sugar phosphate nucleotidyltransferase [Haloarculaceae archaeon H-GB1-1]MEA5388313.1 sugar phosphate nucleotidyltransferase [Haloarculaceae archaeon H-GB11]MEA5406358.1 sugar phosphate nucleotidyltransferase [Haloarculaceae archaeon H-GB2-1]
MHALVPAAGRGTRLRPLTDERPKGLVEVAGKPLLTHCFETLLELPVTELVVVVGYRADQIRDAYGESFRGTPITYVHQPDQRGLGDAVRLADPAIDGPFVLLNGDNVVRANVDEAVARHRNADASATLLVEDVSRAEAKTTGVCVTDDDGSVVRIVEKPDDPPSTLALTGCQVLSPPIFHACELIQPSARDEYELSDALDLLIRAGHTVETVRLDGWRCNVNTDADRRFASRKLKQE